GCVVVCVSLSSSGAGCVWGSAPHTTPKHPATTESLRAKSASAAGGAQASRLRGLLVVAEIALGLVLLIGAGLMIHSLQKLLGVNPGFDAKGVLTVRLDLPESRYAKDGQRVAFVAHILDRITALPAVPFSAECHQLPLTAA